MLIRTDLIAEQREMHTETLHGAENFSKTLGDVQIEKVIIKTEEAAKALSKPKGTYITISFPDIVLSSNYKDTIDSIILSLKELLGNVKNDILVVGLGNSDITPDALGPFTVDRLLATRHLNISLVKELGLGELNSVSSLIPGVLGKTGIEALEIIKGTVERTKPQAVIVIDALAARRTERLFRTVQLCDTGISPGSGVQNSRAKINKYVLGVPVIAVGIPTVADIVSIVTDLGGSIPPEMQKGMMVTPKDIDLYTKRCCDILSEALNLYLQPSLDEETIKALV